MYTKSPEFFHKHKKMSSGVEFSDVVNTSSAIETLYRGDKDVAKLFFLLPTLVLGVFGQHFPRVVNMEQIRLHKLTNLSGDFHMVSMTADPQIGLSWGDGYFITINPALFSRYSVDVHASYYKNQFNFPARMEREKEHLALAVPFCSIKKLSTPSSEWVNPFYLSISPDDKEALIAFSIIYRELVSLLRKKYTQEIEKEEEINDLGSYTRAYLEFYDQYSGNNNPFNKSISELFALYPEFMNNFFQSNPEIPKTGLLKDLVLSSSETLFNKHPYTKIIDASYIHRDKEGTTCYEDDWAKPIYG
ncbi:hypothetical protein OQJ18_06790 [Fluoribacter dumoffii]|uniref:hypothetical protein n=1 Tax=Fluoribacter dumoffii TaxID=463 RepID=UPI0022436F35|nr:hypothetical protein [Fluoribacter dumoffii]MCW8418202.1 hypothetical protein [Fluoribacter dumoffii]MCW8453956.1 hypothetical protein [Fluoribacter dumoffii]MCW8461973.1 hypothetical protein [Fluoribacter dumoffii]MCW8482185.1 hypothetical protein [Fluoribacter dumoffii]